MFGKKNRFLRKGTDGTFTGFESGKAALDQVVFELYGIQRAFCQGLTIKVNIKIGAGGGPASIMFKMRIENQHFIRTKDMAAFSFVDVHTAVQNVVKDKLFRLSADMRLLRRKAGLIDVFDGRKRSGIKLIAEDVFHGRASLFA